MNIKKLIHGFSLFILAVMLVCCRRETNSLDMGIVEFQDLDLTLTVEIAETKDEKLQGLMYRETMPVNQGMLFVYPQERRLSVWMKNTLIPLDILFLSGSGEIVSMHRNVQPCSQLPCQYYHSKQMAQYILELNAGVVDANHIATGHRLKLNLPEK